MTFSSQGSQRHRPSAGPIAPQPASLNGYNTRTFGPGLICNGTTFTGAANWVQTGSGVNMTTNGDGSITIAGGGPGAGFNQQLQTATTAASWKGHTFGGGGYFVATIKFSSNAPFSETGGWPAFWSNDIEGGAGTRAAAQWSGQAAGYNDWMECDFMECRTGTNMYFGYGNINWYNTVGSNIKVQTTFGSATYPGGTNFTQYHRYGCLWVPYANGVQGLMQWYFDDVNVGQTVRWNQYNPALAPPPVYGTSAFSVLDVRHLFLELGCGTATTITVSACEVWQKDTTNNIVQ